LAKKSNIDFFLTAKTPFYKIINEYIEITSLLMNSPVQLKKKNSRKIAIDAYFKKPSFSALTLINLEKKHASLISFIMKKSYHTSAIQRLISKSEV
jgi:hypothetical protein